MSFVDDDMKQRINDEHVRFLILHLQIPTIKLFKRTEGSMIASDPNRLFIASKHPSQILFDKARQVWCKARQTAKLRRAAAIAFLA